MTADREPDAGEELRRAAAHGLRWSAISRPTIELVQMAGIVVLARLIVPAEFGRYAIAAITSEVANLLVAGGLSTALVQRKTLDREHLQSGQAIALLAGLALTLVMLALASLVVAPVFGARTALLVRLLAPLCLVEALGAVPIATLRRRLAFRRVSEVEILNNVSRVAICIALAAVGLGAKALVYGMVASSLAALALAWASAPPPLPRLHRAASRELLGFAVPVSLSTVSWVGFGNVDYAILGARLGPLPTGWFYRAYTVGVEYQNKVATVMTQVGFPVLARTSGPVELMRLYRRMVRLLTISLFPLLALLAIAAPELVPFAFGHRWDASVRPMQILTVGGAATIIFTAVSTVWMATGRGRAMLGYGWAQFLAYGVSVYLVAPHGIVAVAIAAASVQSVFALVAYALMLRGSGERALARLWSDIAPATVSCAVLAAVDVPVSLLLKAAHVSSLPWLAAVGAVAVAPYLATLRLCFPATWREQCAALQRVVPGHRRLSGVRRRLAAAAAG